MNKIALPFVGALLLFSAVACRTFQMGIEPAPNVEPSAAVTAQAPTFTPAAAPLTVTAVPISQPTAPVPPTPARITFPPGGTAYTFAANLTPGVQQGYILGILAQQRMSITTNGSTGIVVLDPSGSVLKPSFTAPGQWQGVMPEKGDYTILFTGQGEITVVISIPPPP